MSESPMKQARPVSGLASEIGWEYIAEVVDVFYNRVALHLSLREPFSLVADWPHHKRRLTYFWWVALGGERFREEQYEPVPKHFRAGFGDALLRDWLELFEKTVAEILPGPLGGAWVERAKQVGAGLIVAHRRYAERNS